MGPEYWYSYILSASKFALINTSGSPERRQSWSGIQELAAACELVVVGRAAFDVMLANLLAALTEPRNGSNAIKIRILGVTAVSPSRNEGFGERRVRRVKEVEIERKGML